MQHKRQRPAPTKAGWQARDRASVMRRDVAKQARRANKCTWRRNGVHKHRVGFVAKCKRHACRDFFTKHGGFA